MGIFDWLRCKTSSTGEETSRGGKIPRFAPISENDEMLLPRQIEFMKRTLDSVKTDVLALQDPSDEMLPECALFVPSLLAEFNENPNLAMVHGLGTAHAWIDVEKLREVLQEGQEIRDYRSLFRAFTAGGYDVKKIKYIRFRSSLRSSDL